VAFGYLLQRIKLGIDYCNIQIWSKEELLTILLNNIKGLAVAEAVKNRIIEKVFP